MTKPIEGELKGRIEIIEEAYEFMLAYAAQGLSGNEKSGPGAQIRDWVGRLDRGLEGLAALMTKLVDSKNLTAAEHYHRFIEVLERDARYTRSAARLILAQRSISSQLIDDLNAWTHLRALLTDLFLIDELFKTHMASGRQRKRRGKRT